MTAKFKPSEVPMNILPTQTARRWIARWQSLRRFCPVLSLFSLLILSPALALAQSGSPFDTGFMALQNLFTGTIAKVASLIAIVIGGYALIPHDAIKDNMTIQGLTERYRCS